MKFPNAHNGVKKIFTAEILGLIGTIAMAVAGGRKATTYMTVAYCLPIVISFVSTLLSLKAESTATMVLSLIALLLSIIAYIIFLNYLRRAVKMLEA